MARPPESPPHSDIDGVHQDEKPNVEAAVDAGQDTGNLKLARDQSTAKPPYAPEKSRDERSS